MNVLWLNAGLLLPLDKGGKLRTWHLMRHLARRHDITYLCFAAAGQPRADVEGMREVAARVVTVPRTDASKGSLAFYADAARYLLNRAPYAVAKYRSRAYADALASLLREESFDLVVCDFLPPIVNLPADLPCPSVLFTHNVEAEIWRRHAETASLPLKRLLMHGQWSRMLAFERAALDRFDLVLAVSDADRATFERLYPSKGRAYHVVPTGVDTEYFAPRTSHVTPSHVARDKHLVFTGSMDWLPNEDGMLYFCREILPRIRQVEPDVTVSIVGRAPTPAVQRLAQERGVEVTGRVEDVRPHIAGGSVYIVPLRIGGGTRLKIFEAMSMAKAVVSTTVGAEGLPVTPGRDIVIADEPARFAQAVVHLLRSETDRRRLEAAARQLVVDRYDWSAVSREFEAALDRARVGAGLQSRVGAGLKARANPWEHVA
jgi:sugar transferase (PEP-CTERM/EpsH1 system associated)